MPDPKRGVRIRGLVKRYPPTTDLIRILRHPLSREEGVTALDGVDLDLAPGRIYGLVGPNGAGKTTLLKIVAGLVLPTQGSVTLDGEEFDSRSQRIRDAIGYVVSDERSFHWRLSVRENLRFFATLQKVDDLDGRVGQCLERVGLADVAGRDYHALSTGMRQRLALARGLLADPRILLMDEATRSLDPLAAEDLRGLLRELFPVGSERTLVYSTHLLSEVEDLCTDLVVLRDGRVAARRDVRADGPPSGGCFTLRTRDPLPAGLFDGAPGTEVLRGSGTTVSLRLSDGPALDALVDRVRQAEVGLVELRPDPWIEDLLEEPGGDA
jgi:ABC-2 type transport system ATP-binding protein